MATFSVNCPHCGGTLEVQDEWAGMETACPLCSKAFIVPRREIPAPPPPPPQQPAGGYSQAGQADSGAAASSVNCPHCGGTLEVQDEWAGMEVSCPLCSKQFVVPRREVSVPADTECETNGQTVAAEGQQEEVSGKGAISAVCGGLATVGYILALIFIMFFTSNLGNIGVLLLIVAVFLSVIAFIFRVKGPSFRLREGESILFTTRLHCCDSEHDDEITYFTRVTNQRIVLSPVEYPFLPLILAGIIEMTARPKSIAFSWDIDDFTVTLDDSKKKMRFSGRHETRIFITDKAFVRWWETKKGTDLSDCRPRACFGISSALLIVALVVLVVVLIAAFSS